MSQYSVVLFHSTAHAIRGEKVLAQAGFRIKMIPTPRQLSSDCGMAIRFDLSLEEQVASTLASNSVPINGIHAIPRLQRQDWVWAHRTDKIKPSLAGWICQG